MTDETFSWAVKLAISDALAQRVADARLWSALATGRGPGSQRALERNQVLNLARELRRPVHGPWQRLPPRPRPPLPGYGSSEGRGKRARRRARNIAARARGVPARDVVVDKGGKFVHVKQPGQGVASAGTVAGKPMSRASAAGDSVRAAAGKPMSRAGKAAVGFAAVIAALGLAHGIHGALVPKRYEE